MQAVQIKMSPITPNTNEIVKRLLIGFALLVGYGTGKYFAALTTDYPSEFFVFGFVIGYILSHATYWAVRRLLEDQK